MALACTTTIFSLYYSRIGICLLPHLCTSVCFPAFLPLLSKVLTRCRRSRWTAPLSNLINLPTPASMCHLCQGFKVQPCTKELLSTFRLVPHLSVRACHERRWYMMALACTTALPPPPLPTHTQFIPASPLHLCLFSRLLCLCVYSYPGVGMQPAMPMQAPVQYAPPAYSQQTVQIPAAPQQWQPQQYNPGQYVQAPPVNQPIQAPSQYMMPSLPFQAPVQHYPTAQSLYATPTYSATYGGFANPQLADGQPRIQPVS
jgi:hypothetical protein